MPVNVKVSQIPQDLRAPPGIQQPLEHQPAHGVRDLYIDEVRRMDGLTGCETRAEACAA